MAPETHESPDNEPVDEQLVENLMDEGYDALRAGFLAEAEAIGRQLLEHRHSSGFEILALSLGDSGDVEEAVQVLEEGVEVAPGVWLLWQLLGNFRSDLGLFTEALEAYDRALFCEDVEKDSVYFNIATVLSRQEKFEEALSYLQLVENDELRLRASALSAELWWELDQQTAALNLAHDTLERLDERVEQLEEEEEPPFGLATIYARLGFFFLEAGVEEDAIGCAEKAVWLDRTDEQALSLIRRLENNTSPDAKYFHVLVEGDFTDDDPELHGQSFFVNYGIVAVDEDDVMQWVHRFEPSELHETLRLTECEAGDPCPDEHLGVYSITGYATFPREQKEQDNEPDKPADHEEHHHD